MPDTARFHPLRDRVLSGVDYRFAEPVKLWPMKGGRTDTARTPHEFEAVLRVGEGKETNAGGVSGGTIAGWRSRLVAGKGELHIDPTVYAGPEILSGDKIEALARPGQPLFGVGAIDARSHTRRVLQLNEG